MDTVDKTTLIETIIEHVHKYDEEGRRVPLTADEVVAYAKTLTKFIEG